jgi:small-conductance mechanosensitive channel
MLKRQLTPWWLAGVAAALLVSPAPALAGDAQPTESAPPRPVEAHVTVMNRPVATFRASFLGIDPAERARRAERRVSELLGRAGACAISIQHEPQGDVLLVDGMLGFAITPGDVDALSGETLETATQAAQNALARVVDETREARSAARLLRALLRAGTATLALSFALFVTARARGWLVLRLTVLLKKQMDRVNAPGTNLLRASRLLGLSRSLVQLISAGVALALVYEWASYSLKQFPYTRVWGEDLNGFLIDIVRRVGGGILGALPDLLIAVVIFVLARGLVALLRPLFEGLEQNRLHVGFLDPDMARATRRIFATIVWILAVVMAYPYLPGSSTEAFKGASVLLGLIVTLGGSSLFGQAASGLILLYSRTVRVGEYVRIAEQEGTVTELGAFTTRMRTGRGEEVTLPNALVLNSVTTNYSRPSEGQGFVLDTTVTIGYDVPWRQVEAMLIEAATRTKGVLSVPPARVFQTALSDFYIEYRLVCQALQEAPRPRAVALSALNANVVDVFNEYGVQIMSPHYRGDPSQPKLVPRRSWHAPPAEPAPHQAEAAPAKPPRG